jgi:hypothetical protein
MEESKTKGIILYVINNLLALVGIWVISSISIKGASAIFGNAFNYQDSYELGIFFVGFLFALWGSKKLFTD